MAMILILILSVMAISLSFIARGETWSSMNYRLMSQARDTAEGGVNQASNFLMFTYAVPGAVGGDPIANYLPLTTSPVLYGGNPVILSADSSVASNYPISSVSSAFNTANQGSLAAGTTTVNYATSAKLLSMRELGTLPAYLAPAGNNTVQTWEITSTGSVAGVQPAQVSVVARLERQIVPVFAYAAFATYNGCDALNFGGGGSTDSYDSGNIAAGFTNTDGNVGTNGSLSTVGATTNIGGSLSTPRTGVGNCTVNNITAWDPSNGTLADGLVELPAEISYPTPTIPPPGTDDLVTNGGCPGGFAGCTVTGGNVHLDPSLSSTPGTINLRDVSMTGGKDLYLKAGTYNINSISQTGATVLHIESAPVFINVTGNGFANNQDVIKLTGGGISNPSLIPADFQIAYAGTAQIKLAGGAEAAALIYAPNATFSLTGGSNWYGALIGKYMTDMGGTAVHYDRRLETTVLKAGPYTLDSFNWQKF